jgi:hypothetical protein
MNAKADEGVDDIELNPEELVGAIYILRQIPGIPDHHHEVRQRREEPRDEYKKRVTYK